MKAVRISTLATATIRETWEIEVPDAVTVDVENALDVLDGFVGDFRLVSIDDEVVGDEHDREVVAVTVSETTGPAPNPPDRSSYARAAANARWAHVTDRTAATAPARRAFQDRFMREVDPDGVLDPVERAKRAENARKAFYLRLALKSAQARRRRKAAP